ncbi:hypothetical protein D3C78_1508200 [compost metagenome]
MQRQEVGLGDACESNMLQVALSVHGVSRSKKIDYKIVGFFTAVGAIRAASERWGLVCRLQQQIHPAAGGGANERAVRPAQAVVVGGGQLSVVA